MCAASEHGGDKDSADADASSSRCRIDYWSLYNKNTVSESHTRYKARWTGQWKRHSRSSIVINEHERRVRGKWNAQRRSGTKATAVLDGQIHVLRCGGPVGDSARNARNAAGLTRSGVVHLCRLPAVVHLGGFPAVAVIGGVVVAAVIVIVAVAVAVVVVVVVHRLLLLLLVELGPRRQLLVLALGQFLDDITQSCHELIPDRRATEGVVDGPQLLVEVLDLEGRGAVECVEETSNDVRGLLRTMSAVSTRQKSTRVATHGVKIEYDRVHAGERVVLGQVRDLDLDHARLALGDRELRHGWNAWAAVEGKRGAAFYTQVQPLILFARKLQYLAGGTTGAVVRGGRATSHLPGPGPPRTRFCRTWHRPSKG